MQHRIPQTLLAILSLLAVQTALAQPSDATDAVQIQPIPMRGEPPEWLTPEVRAQVGAASAEGLGYGPLADGAGPRGPMGFAFIRPGALMVFPSACTIGFVYGSAGAYKLVTAGHCAGDNARVTLATTPTGAAAAGVNPANVVLVEIGTVISRTVPPPGQVGPDYAIIAVDPQWQQSVDADVAEMGGPENGIHSDPVDPAHPVAVKFTGWGGGGTPRLGVALRETWDGMVYCMCPISVGDSGGPVLALTTTSPLGQGFAIITALWPSSSSIAVLTRLTVIGDDLVEGDLHPVPPYCPDAPTQPPSGATLVVCGDTGYAQLTARSSIVSCGGPAASWSCTVLHRADLSVHDLAGCADGDGLHACSALYVPGSASSQSLQNYGPIPSSGMTVLIPHDLCLTEAIQTRCTAAVESLRLPGPPPGPPSVPPKVRGVIELSFQLDLLDQIVWWDV